MKLLYLLMASFLFGVCLGQDTTSDPVPTVPTSSFSSLAPTDIYDGTIDLSLQVVTPQCIQANILGDLDADGSILGSGDEIEKWVLDVSTNKRIQSGQRAQKNMTLKLPPSPQSAILAPLSTGAEVTVMLGYKTRRHGDNRENTIKVKRITLPDTDEECQEPYGRRWSPCSECVCISRAFGGTACKEPMFHPVNVFALPGLSQSLHIQWDFNETHFRGDFNSIGLTMAGFMVNLSRVSNLSREQALTTTSMIVPPSERSFVVEGRIESGITYEVTVSTVARFGPDIMESMVIANSSPTRTLIPVADGTSEPCFLPTTEQLGDEEAQTSLATGVIIITVVVIVIVGLLVAPFVIGAVCVYARKRVDRQNTLLTVSPESHSRDPNTPRLEWNPSYGQFNHTQQHNTSSSNGLYAVLEGRVEVEQRDEESRTEHFDSTGNGTVLYDYITPPRIV